MCGKNFSIIHFNNPVSQTFPLFEHSLPQSILREHLLVNRWALHGLHSVLYTEFHSEMIQFASPNGFMVVMPQGIGIDLILFHFIFLTHEGKEN
jgi:hypothetical protein